jgi:hypothetical protein
MTVTTNEHNHQNLWAKEPTMYMDPNYTVSHNERAELLNGRLAMLGFVAAIVSYACKLVKLIARSTLMPKVG